MILFTKFTILALLASTSVALPKPEIDVRDVADIQVRGLSALFYQHAVQAIKTYGPGVTKTMMHSRIGPEKAFKIAKAKNLQTVETTIAKALMADKKGVYKDTLKKYCIKKDDFCAGDEKLEKDWVAAWDDISKAWAEYAHEETILATNKAGPNPDSFWSRIEEKILKEKNVKITVENDH